MSQKQTKKTTAKKKTKRKVNKKNIFAAIIVIILCAGLIAGIFGLFTLSSMLNNKPTFSVTNFENKESSQIFDKDGNIIADVGTTIRTNITYEDLPESVIDAFVAVEDSRYFEHNGFDIERFSKAALDVLATHSFSQGGSTLTMQLVKQTYFVDEETQSQTGKSIEYKVQQIALALDLEKVTNKKAIFEDYVNKLYFGGAGNIRGIEKAANYYYGKSVTDLNTAEAAMLAGIINRPNAYDPFNYLDYATERRNTVLYLMKYHGYITDAEYKLATSIKVEDLLVNPDKVTSEGGGANYQYQAYIDYVVKEAQELTGLDPTSVSMKIYTYMDPKVQGVYDSIQEGTYEGIEFFDDLVEFGAVSLNNQTGEIVGIAGGRNYGNGGALLLNHATDQYKQPGSSVKPILSYVLAFEKMGWATSHVVVDKPIVYRGTTKIIKNATNTYVGELTLFDAVGNSLNTPAIITLQDYVDQYGAASVVEHLQKLGFSQVTDENFDIGFAIGGSNFTTSPLELAAAHAVMMNEGNYIKPHTIARIEYTDGTEPYEPQYSEEQVVSPEAAWLTSQLMYQAVNGPYYNYMQVLKRDYQVYGKTGTTDWGSDGVQYNIPIGAAKDKWMVSETTNYTTALWLGYEKGIKDKDTYLTSNKLNLNLQGKISSAILDALNNDNWPADYAKPDGVTSITHILGTFPYAYPIEGMDQAFITTGNIKSEFAENMVEAQGADVEQLTSFAATMNDNGAAMLAWAAYPDPSKLQVAEDSMDLSLDENGVYYEAWGKRLFDYTWIFGPIRYKARLTSNGETIAEVSSETETLEVPITVAPGSTVTICGFYGYENLPTNSNEMCADVLVKDQDITIAVPGNTASRQEIEAWINSYSISATINEIKNDSRAGQSEVIYNGMVCSGGNIPVKASEITALNVTVNIYVPTNATPTPTP